MQSNVGCTFLTPRFSILWIFLILLHRGILWIWSNPCNVCFIMHHLQQYCQFSSYRKQTRSSHVNYNSLPALYEITFKSLTLINASISWVLITRSWSQTGPSHLAAPCFWNELFIFPFVSIMMEKQKCTVFKWIMSSGRWSRLLRPTRPEKRWCSGFQRLLAPRVVNALSRDFKYLIDTTAAEMLTCYFA